MNKLTRDVSRVYVSCVCVYVCSREVREVYTVILCVHLCVCMYFAAGDYESQWEVGNAGTLRGLIRTVANVI